ncbi:MAG: twin-arginine translocase subunit TatB, partial [Hyphomicrobium sp.]|nr:twin-arginine translocase subunit TatB [Hyphomicrobium sp.]
MFDLTSGKLLLLGIVALIVLGPKDFPILLRTIGKYMGIIKRQADEFRAQFDEAMRESELDQIKKDVEGLGQDLNQSMQETQNSLSSDLSSVTK